MVLMSQERCSLDRESCLTISLSPTPTRRQRGLPTAELCLQTSATLSMPGNASQATTLHPKLHIFVGLTVFLAPSDTEEKTTCSAC